MRHLFERLKTLVYLSVIQLIDALGAELLDVERRNHRTVDHRPSQRVVIDLLLRGKVTHKPAGKGIPRTSRIENTFKRVRRNDKVSVTCEQSSSVFSALNYDSFEAVVHDRFRGFMDVWLISQLSGLGVINDDTINDFYRFDKG